MDNIDTLLEVASLMGKKPKIHVYNSARGHYRTINEAYESALRPGPEHDGRTTEEWSLGGYPALVAHNEPLETLPVEEREKVYLYLRMMNDSANSRPTFATENGLIGIAHSKNFDLSLQSKDGFIGVGDSKEVRTGDVVYVFLGASVHFILREVEDGQFRLICDAYVQGIMDGETMRKNLEIRQFDIT